MINSDGKKILVNTLAAVIANLTRFEISAPTANKIMEEFNKKLDTIEIPLTREVLIPNIIEPSPIKQRWSQQDNTILGNIKTDNME